MAHSLTAMSLTFLIAWPSVAAAYDRSHAKSVPRNSRFAPEEVVEPHTPPGDCVPRLYNRFAAPATTLSAVFYYPWYEATAQCPNEANTKWCACFADSKPGNPRPVLGYSGSNDLAKVGAHFDQMVQHGVDVVGVEWNHEPLELASMPVIAEAIASRDLKFVLLYDLAIRMNAFPRPYNFDDPDLRANLIGDFATFANDPAGIYFKHPKYLKFANRPVVYIYLSREIGGSNEGITSAFDQARAAAMANGFAGLYIVADHLFFNAIDYQKLHVMGAQAATSFGPMYANGVSGPQPVRRWADRMSAELYQASRGPLTNLGLIDLQPGIFVQYDETGVSGHCDNRPLPPQVWRLEGPPPVSDWEYMINTAAMPHRLIAEKVKVTSDCEITITTNNTNRTSIVWTYSFNEWGEGTGLEPLEARSPPYPFGFGTEPLQKLHAHVHASGASGPPPAPIARVPDGVNEGLRPHFGWDGVPFANQYEVKVYDEGGQFYFSRIVTTNSYQPDFDLVASESTNEYTWEVRAHNNVGWGPVSDPRVWFKLIPIQSEPAPPPVPIGPSGCIQTTTPTLTWHPAPGAVDYRVVVSEDSPEVHVINNVPVSGTSFTVPFHLIAGKLYRWKVKSSNNAGVSPFSAHVFFTPGCGGKDDIAWYRAAPTNAVTALLSDGTQLTSAGQWLTGFGAPDWAAAGDFNGDGKDDLAWYEVWNNKRITVALSNGAAFSSNGPWFENAGQPTWASVGDFNGDGKDDIAWYEAWNNSGIIVLLSTGFSFINAGQWIVNLGTADWRGVGDFDGDGRDDVAWYQAWNQGGIIVLRSTGSTLVNAGQWITGLTTVPTGASVGDFNGDNRDDIGWYHFIPSSAITVLLSEGTRLNNAGQWVSGLGVPTLAAVGDANGDGKDDVGWYESQYLGGRIIVFLSSGSAFTNNGEWITGLAPPAWAGIGNFNGQ